MGFVLAFVIGGLVCAVFELVSHLVKVKVPVLLLIGVALGGLFGACGIAAALLGWGGAGFGIMVVGFGNGVYQAAVSAFAGDALPAVLVVGEVVILSVIGILASICRARAHKD